MRLLIMVLGLALAVQASAVAAGAPSTNVAWRSAASDTDIARAFAQARAEGKPVLLYWGASWCPPCNQLKATLFNRQDFATLAHSFVSVNVDGDNPGAQRLGSRFKVSGYPTLVLFKSDGTEITRLPGEVDAPQALAVLQIGLAGGRPAGAVLAEALAGKVLSGGEWRMLAFYSWETDDQQLAASADLPGLLARLAAACPASEPETSTRLGLKALAAGDEGKGLKPDAAWRERVRHVLADRPSARALADVITHSAADIVRSLEPQAGAGRLALLAEFDTALKRLQTDATQSRGDRLAALDARVELARLDQPKSAVQVKLPEALLNDVRQHVARDDREISDGYERQAVITEAAGTLGLAGLWAESDALLKSNLARSHSPYYLMSQLGRNARQLGRNDEALRWYGQAYDRSQGPATRLQWGASYLGALVDLAPRDGARIEKTASRLLGEAASDTSALEGRSLRSLQRAGSKIAAWNGDGRQTAVLRRLQRQLDVLCARTDADAGQRAACHALFKAPPKKA